VLRRPDNVLNQVRNALAQGRPKPAFHSPIRVSPGVQTRIPRSDAGSEAPNRGSGRRDSN
jgi:hypothetical protein